MKPWQMGAALILSSGTLAGSAVRQAAAPPAPVWLSDFGAAQETSRQTGKPLFVAFR